MIDQKIGQRIREIRKGWGLSQIELAERVGISFQQIQKYEKGTTRISVMRLHQIAEALGAHITRFFEEGESNALVSDVALGYSPEGQDLENIRPLSKEEIALLKLFRKIKNNKLRAGIIKQLRGALELENSK